MPQFVVDFADPKGFFYPGEIIVGRVIVRLDEAITFREMTLRFKGKSEVHWTTGSGDQRKFHSNKEVYIDTRLSLLESPQPNTYVSLQSGEFSYPFQFQLPQDLPPSAHCSSSGGMGFVHYLMTIEIFTKNNTKTPKESASTFFEVSVHKVYNYIEEKQISLKTRIHEQ